MSEPNAAPPFRPPITDFTIKYRWLHWAALILLFAFAFNGQWRVGRDSALYRGLAHSIATGKGYSFGDFGSRQIYPGLPVLLAGLEKVFGPSSVPPIIMVHLFSLGCLIFTYKLVRLRFDEWIAIAVTFCVGVHGWYLELTNEIRDDIPFLFGMLVALYGWERLRLAIGSDKKGSDPFLSTGGGAVIKGSLPFMSRTAVRAGAFLVVGLAIAAVMRPTFIILAAAWVIVCVWGLITGPKRKFYAICLGVLMAVWLAMILLDPRTRGFKPLGGGYEYDASVALGKAAENISKNIWKVVSIEIAHGFFGQRWLPGMTQVMNLIAIGASLLLLKKNPMWTLLILFTVVVMMLMTPVPRYLVMVIPLLMLAWVLLIIEIAKRVPPQHASAVIFVGLAAVIVPNLIRCGKVIGQQRGWQSAPSGGLAQWQCIIDMGYVVKQLVPPGEKVIAPGATIMSYYSERECVMARDILPRSKHEVHWPRHLDALNIRYAVFPSDQYMEGERKIRELMDKGVIVPDERVAKVGDLALMRVHIEVPPVGVDWRKRPVATTRVTVKTTSGGTTRPAKATLARKARHAAAIRKAAAEAKARHAEREARLQRQEAADAKAALRRKQAKFRRAREAAIRAATQKSTTQPASTQRAGKEPSALLPLPARGERAGERGERRPLTSQRSFPIVRTLPLSLILSPVYRGGEGTRSYFDPGGFVGQSFALRSDSIVSAENFRGPRFMPWQRCAAASQFSFDARLPSQNGHVRHCSGRTS
jgi:hypothetical protein